MKAGEKCIKLLDLGSGVMWFYDPRTRCSTDPLYLYAQSPFMATQNAFIDCFTLSLTKEGEEVFVESVDMLYTLTKDGNLAPGNVVWRKCRIVGFENFPERNR